MTASDIDNMCGDRELKGVKDPRTGLQTLSTVAWDNNMKTVKDGLFDEQATGGHGGNKCSIFLQENLHNYIFESDYFPLYTNQAISTAYVKAEEEFLDKATDETGKLIDKSGSCSISALIMDDWCFIINLGDSRALYSFNAGKRLMQVSRDHKPNDPIERERIEKAGGSVYRCDFVMVNGEKVQIDEKNIPEGASIPYRMIPGNIAVRKFLFNIFNS